MTEGERVQEWVRCLNNCDTYNSKGANLKYIHDHEPKLEAAILKAMKLKTPEDLVEWIAK